MTKANSQLITSLKNLPVESIGTWICNFRGLIYISTATQTLFLSVPERKQPLKYPISSALKGTGSLKGSNKTPQGLHRVCRIIGKNAPAGTVFISRRKTGRCWNGEEAQGDLILSRIIRIKGLEEGVNKGGDVDSFDRYIYLHGTNHEYAIGTPASHGCIRMKNRDIIELSTLVREGTLVYIN